MPAVRALVPSACSLVRCATAGAAARPEEGTPCLSWVLPSPEPEGSPPRCPSREEAVGEADPPMCRPPLSPVEFDEPTDFVFLMDGSSSVGRDNFDKVKEFIKLTINKILSKELNVNNMLRLLVIQYSHNGAQRLEVPFTNIKEDALSRLSKVTYMNEGMDLPDALRFVTKHLKCDARPNVKSQIFIFSDGRSSGNAQHQIAAQAAEAINPKTELFAITVGTFHELGISQLVSGKEENFNFNKIEDKIFRVSEYNDLLKRVTVQSFLKKITF
ncbi:collagen alpha-1(VI) chain-like [Gastrophryne carolinensis]